MRIKLSSESVVYDILKATWKLSKEAGMESIIRKNLNEKERDDLKPLKEQVKAKN